MIHGRPTEDGADETPTIEITLSILGNASDYVDGIRIWAQKCDIKATKHICSPSYSSNPRHRTKERESGTEGKNAKCYEKLLIKIDWDAD